MMNSIKQNILEITKKIKSLDRFLIVDLETDRLYISRNLDNIQLKELQKPIIAEIKTNLEAVNIRLNNPEENLQTTKGGENE